MIARATVEAITALAADSSARPLDAALLIGRCLNEACDADGVRRTLAGMTEQCDGAPWEHLRQLGFGALRRAADDDVPALSRIDLVLERRRGLPIALGTLLIEVAEGVGRRATGINFPGHFLVRIDDQLVDPLHMTPRSEAECLALLPVELTERDGDAMFEEAGAHAILLRMLNNLKYHYLGIGELSLALDMVECQLKALPGDPGLLLEQGTVWLRLGSIQSARQAFVAAEAAAAASGNAEAAVMARRRLETLADRNELRH